MVLPSDHLTRQFGTMSELFASPSPVLHSNVFRSLENMSKDTSLDDEKRAQANFNAGTYVQLLNLDQLSETRS